MAKLKERITNLVDKLNNNKTVIYVKEMMGRFDNNQIPLTSAATSYYLFFSIFPLILFLISLFNLIDPTLVDRFSNELAGASLIIPEPVINVLENFINTIGQSNSISVVSFSGIALLWSASSAFGNIVNSLNKIYARHNNDLNFIVKAVSGIVSALTIGLLLLLILVFLSFSELILSFIDDIIYVPVEISNFINGIGTYLIAFAVLVLIFFVIYSALSRWKSNKWFSLGSAAFTASAWMIISFVMSNIISSNERYDVIYGSLAAIIFLLLWMFAIVLSLMIGAFIHTELMRRWPKKEKENIDDEPTDTGGLELDEESYSGE